MKTEQSNDIKVNLKTKLSMVVHTAGNPEKWKNPEFEASWGRRRRRRNRGEEKEKKHPRKKEKGRQ